MTRVKAVLFDFGHTLVDFHRTEEALHAAYEQIRDRVEAVAYMEVPELLDLIERVAGEVDRQVADSYAQRRLEELDIAALFRDAFGGVGFDLPADVIEHVVALDHSAYSNSITIAPETLDLLRGLREDGRRLGLVSNMTLRPDLMRGDLSRLGITPLFDASVFSSEVGVRKPDARIFREALSRVGTDPSDTVFVGDRVVDDVGGAHAVGMRTVLTRQFRQEDDPEGAADWTIEDLGQLPGVIAGWEDGRT